MEGEDATELERGVFMDEQWAPRITELRERWHAADQAHREVERLETYYQHWIADEPGDMQLWPSRDHARSILPSSWSRISRAAAAPTTARWSCFHPTCDLEDVDVPVRARWCRSVRIGSRAG